MSENKRLNNYDELPLVLDVADIQRIMGISRVTAYELVHTPGFPAFRSGRLIKVISDVHQMTNAQLKRIIQKIEVDKDGNVDIYLRIFGDLGLDETVLISDNQT